MSFCSEFTSSDPLCPRCFSRLDLVGVMASGDNVGAWLLCVICCTQVFVRRGWIGSATNFDRPGQQRPREVL